MNPTTHENTRRSRNGVSATLAALCLALTATAGQANQRPDTEHLTWTNGLSQTTIFSIQADQQGSVWFATEDGLNRFDGQTFTVYRNDPDYAGSLPANLVRGVDAAPDGRIWAATEGGGVAAWDPATNSFTRFGRKPLNGAPAISSDYNRSVLADRLGSVWIATRSSGLDRLDPATGTVNNYRNSGNDPASLANDEVYALLESRDGGLFVGTNRGLDRYEAATNSFEHINLGSPSKKIRVRALFEDRAGLLWIGTNGAGLFSFDPLTGAVTHYCHERDDDTSLGDDHVQSILEDDFGQLWIGTASGLNLLDREDGTFERYGAVDISATGGSGSVTALHLDNAGSLWVGTELGGLIRWEGRTGHFRATGRSVTNIVTSFTENKTGRVLYFGTVGEGLVQLRSDGRLTRFKVDEEAGSISDDRVMSLLRDSAGRIWVGTMRGGLNRFKPGQGVFSSYRHDPLDPTSLSSDGVMAIHEDPLGQLWVGTFGGGLNAFDARRSKFFAFRHDANDPTTLSSDRVTAVLGTRSGMLWVGTDGGGLNLFDPATGVARRFQHDPEDPASLPADTVCSLHIDERGTLWVGTRGGGLARMVSEPTESSDPMFLSYTEADGLPNSVIYTIQPNGDGQLWLSTNHGLSLFNPSMRSFTNFDVNDGLQANEFNFGASFRGLDGTLYFGGINGYNAFLPLPLDSTHTDQDGRGARHVGRKATTTSTATPSAGF